MHILITGGTGLIGRSLCAVLLAAGHQLTVLSRKPDSVAAKCGPTVKALASLKDWRPEINFEAIINLAGEPIVDRPWTSQRKQRLWDSRVGLTRQLLTAIQQAENKPRVLLSGSAIGYYGAQGDGEIHEAAAPAEDFAAKLCVAWEEAAQDAAGHGVRVCLLRTGLVLHPTDGLLGRMLLPFKLGLGAKLGDGSQWMSWIHIQDHIGIMQRLLQEVTATGAYNLTAPEPVTNQVFTQTLARAVHRPALFTAPGWLLRPLLGERASLILGGQKVLPTKVQALGYQFKYPTLAAAFDHLTL